MRALVAGLLAGGLVGYSLGTGRWEVAILGLLVLLVVLIVAALIDAADEWGRPWGY